MLTQLSAAHSKDLASLGLEGVFRETSDLVQINFEHAEGNTPMSLGDMGL